MYYFLTDIILKLDLAVKATVKQKILSMLKSFVKLKQYLRRFINSFLVFILF